MHWIVCMFLDFREKSKKHVKIFSERSKKIKKQKKNKGSVLLAKSAYISEKAQFGLVLSPWFNFALRNILPPINNRVTLSALWLKSSKRAWTSPELGQFTIFQTCITLQKTIRGNNTRLSFALDGRTIFCLYFPGFQRQVFKHVKILSERSKEMKEQKKNKGNKQRVCFLFAIAENDWIMKQDCLYQSKALNVLTAH